MSTLYCKKSLEHNLPIILLNIICGTFTICFVLFFHWMRSVRKLLADVFNYISYCFKSSTQITYICHRVHFVFILVLPKGIHSSKSSNDRLMAIWLMALTFPRHYIERDMYVTSIFIWASHWHCKQTENVWNLKPVVFGFVI